MKLCEIVDSSHIFADQPAEIIAPLLKKLQISANLLGSKVEAAAARNCKREKIKVYFSLAL